MSININVFILLFDVCMYHVPKFIQSLLQTSKAVCCKIECSGNIGLSWGKGPGLAVVISLLIINNVKLLPAFGMYVGENAVM